MLVSRTDLTDLIAERRRGEHMQSKLFASQQDRTELIAARRRENTGD